MKEEFQTRGYRVKDPPERTNINDGVYDGWILPVAVRATSGHSYKRKNEVGITLDPTAMMRKLDMNTAMKIRRSLSCNVPIIPRVNHRQWTDARRHNWEENHELLWNFPTMG